jgi:Cof subfamily protein (haloacid dehalogenase superfamily)
MIAIDLDGTLLSPTGTVTERTKSAVHKCLSAGMLVCFATGRNWTESKTVLDAVAHYDTAVFAGGAMVVDTKHRVVLHRMGMQPALANEVCAFFESRGHAALALQDSTVAGCDYLVSSAIELNPETALWMKISKAVVHRAADLSSRGHEHTIRVGIVAATESAEKLSDDLAEQFGSRIVFNHIPLLALGLDVLEVFDPAVNKWEGIQHVARRHGIRSEQIIAIGDDVNDLPMLKNAGLGVSMGNARPEIQAVAKRVIGTNREEGLARFLEELVAEHEVQPLDEDAAA